MHENINISTELTEALAAAKPVVALESTIISHGMPWPQNYDCASEVEAIVRQEGALPATIAVIDGQLHVGLNDEQLKRLAQAENVMKVSSRDLPYALARGVSAGCTVAATLLAAEKVGIRVFATGGIGGVHRGAQESFDVSADLLALSRSRVAVVCAGPKAILDLPLTLEKLETLNVAVLAYQTHKLPAFYTRDSGLAVSSVDSVEELALFMQHNTALDACGGPLVCLPLPHEYALDREELEGIIGRALAAAPKLSGKDVTPYLLKAVVEASGGRSLAANIALIKNNARLAAQLARALSK